MEEKELSRSLRLARLQNFLAMKTPSGGATLEQIMEHCKCNTEAGLPGSE